ncbi:MAG: hypothetical protein ACYDBY_16615 [Thermoanaerobaculia bacterium]
MRRNAASAALALIAALLAAGGCGLPERVRGFVAGPPPTPLPRPTPVPAPPLEMSFLGVREDRVRGGAAGPAGTTIEVALVGTKRGDVETARVVVETAVDDLGTSLVPAGVASSKHEPLRGSDAAAPVVLSIPLKLASRNASSLREVSGTIELYVPDADPGAVVTAPRFRSLAGSPLASPALAGHAVTIALASAQEAEALPADPDDLVLRVADPNGRVEGFYFVDPEGTAWATDREERGGLVVVSARAETPGPEWGLRVRLKTPSTLRRYRFALKDVPLP